MGWPFAEPLVSKMPVIATGSVLSIGGGHIGFFEFNAFSNATANRAYYLPFRLAMSYLARIMFAGVGNTAAGNGDMGIYDKAGTLLVSTGSVAISPASGMQVFDIADTMIGPGLFYMAVAFSSASLLPQITTSMGPQELRSLGVREEASAFPLPAVATFGNPATNRLYMFGLSDRTLI